jgi:hypothetical protein
VTRNHRRGLTTTKEAPERSPIWEDEDFVGKGITFSAFTRKNMLSVALEPGEITVRTRYRYFQPAFSVRLHRGLAYIQAGTRTLWIYR